MTPLKLAARILFIAGAIGIGLFFVRASPREVTLVYGLGAGARALAVEIEKGGAVVRRAEFRVDDAGEGQLSHRVRLTDGDYVLRFTISADGVAREVERPITVRESGTIVIPLGQ